MADPVADLRAALVQWEPPGTTFTVAIVDAARVPLDALPEIQREAQEDAWLSARLSVQPSDLFLSIAELKQRNPFRPETGDQT